MLDQKHASEITRILNDWNNGETGAQERLMPYVYDELKRQARILMSRERLNHTLQPTALVHEAFIKISKDSGIEWKNRSHFYGIASHLMRQILVQHARMHTAEKRGGNSILFSIDDVQVSLEERAGAILDLDEVLEKLARINEEQSKIVEMKFFGGLSHQEIAEALGISERTVVRKWRAARLWLYRELSEG
jgi:RNA polymerase sigma factor (TIGR02999 family)